MSTSTSPRIVDPPSIEIAPDDPLVAHLQRHAGVTEIDRLQLDSPTLAALRQAGVKLAVPLISQGELVGLINLGPRLSEQEYSSDDRRLLDSLAGQAAPALRVAQMVRQQQAELQARERIEQQLRLARVIQQTLLPKEVPRLTGWDVAAYYRPAWEVGGDFYDFIALPDGRLALMIADVTDKGVPSALVMATTRSILRSAAEQCTSPGAVLRRANEVLLGDIPPSMFVTCLYMVLDPATGTLHYANAGHDLPYRRTGGRVEELRATGMPLGLLPGMDYEEKETRLRPGDTVLLYSDGLAEAHDAGHEMFGFPRVKECLLRGPEGGGLIAFLLEQLAAFTGSDWVQEDDVTLVTLSYLAGDGAGGGRPAEHGSGATVDWTTLSSFSLPSRPGNERHAIAQVVVSVRDLGLSVARLERLKTAVGEATMNAMEHGNRYHEELPVEIEVRISSGALSVRVRDQSGDRPLPSPAEPDLAAKLAGEQPPRGWGLFLMRHMVDDLRLSSDGVHFITELILYRDESEEGESRDGATV